MKPILITLILSVSLHSVAQNSLSDSLLKVAVESKDYKKQVDTYYYLSQVSMDQGLPEDCEKYILQARSIAEQNRDQVRVNNAHFFTGYMYCQQYESDTAIYLFQKVIKGSHDDNEQIVGQALLFTGISYTDKLQNDSASIYFKKAIDIFLPLAPSKNLASSYQNYGIHFWSEGNLPEALENMLSAMRIFEDLNNEDGIGKTLINLGLINIDMGNNDEGVKCYMRALEIGEKFDNDPLKWKATYNLASHYGRNHIFDQAQYYFRKTADIVYRNGNSDELASVFNNLSTFYSDLFLYWNDTVYEQIDAGRKTPNKILQNSMLDSAVAFNIKAENLVRSLNNVRGIALAMNARGYILQLKKDYTNAISYFKESLVLADSVQAWNVTEHSNMKLFEIYSELKDYENALHHYQLYIAAKDTIFSESNSRQLQDLQTHYETEKKDKEITVLNKDNALKAGEISKQKIIRNATIAGLFGALFFLSLVFLQKKRIAKEKARSEELLLNILPYETAKELKEKGSAEAKMFDEVTVLFTDFKDFTRLSEILSPHELVAEIHFCFKAFDEIMADHNIEKIKTIGDSYMAAGGLPVLNKTNALDVVAAALKIQHFMKHYKELRNAEGKHAFDIRIGVHTGPVVAGIVGIKKFQYDIWGDTVNTASRMESSGEAGMVNISDTTYQIVKERYKCTPRGKVMAKGKGEIEMYFVESMESQ